MAEQCDTCKFYRLRTHGTAPNAKTVPECRVSDPVFPSGWPQVKPDDWCGKYVAVVLRETRMLGEIPL